MSLTVSEPPVNVSPKRTVWYVIIAVLLLAIALVVLWKFVLNKPLDEVLTEDKLPAIKVQILNGCGFEGLAGEYQDFIKDKNISVESTGDTAKPIYDKSLIVVRKGDLEDLSRLQKMTGIKLYTLARTEYSNVDFDIVLGRDYDQYMN